MRTKVMSFFIFFQELFNKKKIKALRPKMTKIASRGGGGPALKTTTLVTPKVYGKSVIMIILLGNIADLLIQSATVSFASHLTTRRSLSFSII